MSSIHHYHQSPSHTHLTHTRRTHTYTLTNTSALIHTSHPHTHSSQHRRVLNRRGSQGSRQHPAESAGTSEARQGSQGQVSACGTAGAPWTCCANRHTVPQPLLCNLKCKPREADALLGHGRRRRSGACRRAWLGYGKERSKGEGTV